MAHYIEMIWKMYRDWSKSPDERKKEAGEERILALKIEGKKERILWLISDVDNMASDGDLLRISSLIRQS